MMLHTLQGRERQSSFRSGGYFDLCWKSGVVGPIARREKMEGRGLDVEPPICTGKIPLRKSHSTKDIVRYGQVSFCWIVQYPEPTLSVANNAVIRLGRLSASRRVQ